MKIIAVLAALICLSPTLAFAGNWSGYLVDSKCYTTVQENTRTAGQTSVDRNKDLEVGLCRPSPKTKSFAIVQFDGLSLKLNSAGNAQAANLVKMANTKQNLKVAVTGEVNNKTIDVRSISITK